MSSTWIALKVPADTASALAVPGYERPEALHLTLAFLGKGLTAVQVADVRAAVARWARTTPPLSGLIHALGRFEAVDHNVVWASVRVPRLRVAREALLASLPVPLATEHAWLSHITLAFVPKDVEWTEPVPRLPVAFDTVQVWSGGKSWSYKLRGKR